jgi:hypothetical protein
MLTSIETLNILLFLIPGFISSAVFTALTVRPAEQGELKRIAEALIFSMLVYALYSPFGRNPISLNEQNELVYDLVSFLLLLAFSLVFPVLLSYSVTNDLHMRFARWAGITNRTARSSTWYDVFSDESRPVVIRFNDGRKIGGWPEHYSDDPNEPYVYLTHPHQIDHEGRPIDAGYHGVLITPQMEIDYVWLP